MSRGREPGGRSRDRARPRTRNLWGAVGAGLLVAGAAVALVVTGCGADEQTTTTAAGATATTAAYSDTVARDGEGGLGVSQGEGLAPTEADEVASAQGVPTTVPGAGGLGAAEKSLDRKVIGNASILIEVSEGTFQTTFNQALQLADTYGGYVVSSNATAAEGEDTLRSGTVTVRVPSQSFDEALTDAGELGEVKNQTVDTQDVTEEYVDLQARLVNAKAQEASLRSLMQKAGTIDEVLQVQQYLAQTQMEIEQLTGRLRFLDEHTSYSTITISIYESGTDVPDDDGWGFVAALEDALHAFVDGVNTIIVGLGGALPALILIGVLAYVVYRIVAPRVRRDRGDRQGARAAGTAQGQPWQPGAAGTQVGQQGYGYPAPYPGVAPAAPGAAEPTVGQETQASGDRSSES